MLGLLNLPVSVCAVSPGCMAVTVLVCTTVTLEVLAAVAPVPVPEPPAVQYAKAAPPPARTARAAIMMAAVFLVGLRIVISQISLRSPGANPPVDRLQLEPNGHKADRLD